MNSKSFDAGGQVAPSETVRSGNNTTSTGCGQRYLESQSECIRSVAVPRNQIPQLGDELPGALPKTTIATGARSTPLSPACLWGYRHCTPTISPARKPTHAAIDHGEAGFPNVRQQLVKLLCREHGWPLQFQPPCPGDSHEVNDTRRPECGTTPSTARSWPSVPRACPLPPAGPRPAPR